MAKKPAFPFLFVGISRQKAQEWCIKHSFELVELSPEELPDEDGEFWPLPPARSDFQAVRFLWGHRQVSSLPEKCPSFCRKHCFFSPLNQVGLLRHRQSETVVWDVCKGLHRVWSTKVELVATTMWLQFFFLCALRIRKRRSVSHTLVAASSTFLKTPLDVWIGT